MDLNPKTAMNREKEIFDQALDLSSVEERAAFLKGACGTDVTLLERLMGLLRASDGADAFLPNEPRAASKAILDVPAVDEEALGSRVHHYRLLKKVGEGGNPRTHHGLFSIINVCTSASTSRGSSVPEL